MVSTWANDSELRVPVGRRAGYQIDQTTTANDNFVAAPLQAAA